MDEESAQLAQALQAASALGAQHAKTWQGGEVAPGVELVAAAPDLSELEAEGGQLGDVVVELIDATLDGLDLVQASGLLGAIGRAEYVEVELVADSAIAARSAIRWRRTSATRSRILAFSARARSGSRVSSGAGGAGVTGRGPASRLRAERRPGRHGTATRPMLPGAVATGRPGR